MSEKIKELSQSTPVTLGLVGSVLAIAVWVLTSFGDLRTEIRLHRSELDRLSSEVKIIKTDYPTQKEINLRFDILEAKIDQLKSVKN